MSPDTPHRPVYADPRWPSAGEWFAASRTDGDGGPTQPVDLGLLGVPAHSTSISTTGAHLTPGAVRDALRRFSTWATSMQSDLRALAVADLGDVPEPDGAAGEERTRAMLSGWTGRLLVALGGDNSITYAVSRAMNADGLVTLDAHHDVRDGQSNGSPVARLIDAGLDGRRVVQIGISDYANSREYADRAHDFGITVIHRDEVQQRGIAEVTRNALDLAGAGHGSRVHVDLDVDVCDQAVAPACPASLPGGLSAYELRQAARIAGSDPRVVSVDLVEVDVTRDGPDLRTVRLVAACVLEAAAGLLLQNGT